MIFEFLRTPPRTASFAITAPLLRPKSVLITLTPDHCESGRPGDCNRCPIALAVLDALPHYGKMFCGIEVTTEAVSLREELIWTWQAKMPRAGADFIERYDDFPTIRENLSFTLDFERIKGEQK